MSDRIREKLIELGNLCVVGVSPHLAAKFNRWAKTEYPSEYEKALTIRQQATRYTRRYSRDCCYTWIKHPDLPNQDPYPKAPTPAELLSNIIITLVRKS